MSDYSVLVGNDINNIFQGNSWLDVLKSLEDKYGIKTNTINKPFPLAYEEIYFNILNTQPDNFSENDIKDVIANKIKTIIPNDIHKEIIKLNCTNILTTNYDLAFEICLDENLNIEDLKNEGKIKESKYNIFRHHQINGKKIWHIHGALTLPSSIILGYEHYSGYLQNMRGYTTTGSQYKNQDFNKPLTNRLSIDDIGNSWIDDFFTKDIYIFGLNLDFVEIDLWWLLTFRERYRLTKKSDLYNKITYYIPQCFYETPSSKPKIELLQSVGVEVNFEFGSEFNEKKREYYLSIINDISRKSSS